MSSGRGTEVRKFSRMLLGCDFVMTYRDLDLKTCLRRPMIVNQDDRQVRVGLRFVWEMRHTGTASWRSMTGRLSIPFYTISRCASTLVVCVKLMLVLTSLFDADNSSASNDVMLLTTKNFDVVAADTKHLFVQFCKYLDLDHAARYKKLLRFT